MPLHLFIGDAYKNYIVYVRINGGGVISQRVVSDSAGVISIVDLSEYITSGLIEVTVKDSKGKEVVIPFGDQCLGFCSIELNIEMGGVNNYPNVSCANKYNCTWSVPFYNCTFTTKLYNCTWVLKNMNKIIHNGIEYNISATPTIVVNNVLEVNPAYIAELNAIEDGAFSAILINDNLSVNYQGLAVVDFYNGCKEVLKSCV